MVWHVGDIGYADVSYANAPFRFSFEAALNGYFNWMENITANIWPT